MAGTKKRRLNRTKKLHRLTLTSKQRLERPTKIGYKTAPDLGQPQNFYPLLLAVEVGHLRGGVTCAGGGISWDGIFDFLKVRWRKLQIQRAE